MGIKVECGECGREYNVKDELEGKKIRCKACSTMILVKSADEDEWDESIDEEEFLPPKQKKSAAKKKGRRRSRGGGMPGAIVIALICLGLMIAISALDFVGTIMIFQQIAVDNARKTKMLTGAVLRVVVQLLIFMGVMKGTASTKTISIVMAILTSIILGLRLFLGISRGGLESLELSIAAFSIVLRVVYIGCMLTSDAESHMSN